MRGRGRLGSWRWRRVEHLRRVALDLLDELIPLRAVRPAEELEAYAALPVVVAVANHGRMRLKRLRRPVRQLYLHANELA